MTDEQIKEMLSQGWWVQVSPLAHKGWVCGLYKKGKKTGNWITEMSMEFETPNECYNWASLKIKYENI